MTSSVPVAVSPAVRSPGLWLLVNMLAGNSAPGSSSLRALMIAPKGSSGTITPDTELKRAVAGDEAVSTFLGPGTPGHLASKALFREYGLAQVDLVAPTASAGTAATGTFTYNLVPTVTWDVTFKICGREIVCSWAAGATAIAGATAAVAAINLQTNDLPVTAANGAGTLAVVTLTFKVTGTWGNDCLISVTQANGATGTVTASGAALTGGTQEHVITTALTTVANTEYDLILLCTGNDDAKAASATSGPGRLKTHIDGLDSGRRAKLQQCVIGLTGALADAKAGANQHNFGPMQYIFCQAGQSLPCEIGAAELGARFREEMLDPAANRIETPYQATLYGAADLNADALTDIEVEDALQSGVTPVVYDATDQMMPSRPITTYYKDSAGNPDDRILDTSRVSGIYAVAKDLRIAIPREFPRAKLSEDLTPGEEPLPEGVVEVRDVKGFTHTRVKFWISKGVVIKAKYEEAYANGQFLVRVNPTDAAQCDIVLPLGIVPPLAKFSLVVNHVGPN